MLLFYDIQIKIETQNFIFQRSDSNHITKVLRKKSGDEIKITEGKGLEWTGKLTVITPQKTCAEKIKVLPFSFQVDVFTIEQLIDVVTKAVIDLKIEVVFLLIKYMKSLGHITYL